MNKEEMTDRETMIRTAEIIEKKIEEVKKSKDIIPLIFVSEPDSIVIGRGEDVLAMISCLVTACLDDGMPEDHLDAAIETGKEFHKKHSNSSSSKLKEMLNKLAELID